MGRLLHAVLLIAALLACPYRCLGSTEVVYIGDGESPSCCCCEHCGRENTATEPPHEQGPMAPAEECQCGQCLCQGAVLTDNDSVRQITFAGPWSCDAPPLVLPARPDAPANWRDGPPLARSAAGRPLRLVLQSLLI